MHSQCYEILSIMIVVNIRYCLSTYFAKGEWGVSASISIYFFPIVHQQRHRFNCSTYDNIKYDNIIIVNENKHWTKQQEPEPEPNIVDTCIRLVFEMRTHISNIDSSHTFRFDEQMIMIFYFHFIEQMTGTD